MLKEIRNSEETKNLEKKDNHPPPSTLQFPEEVKHGGGELEAGSASIFGAA
jgi:hypothetical protein